ANSHGRELPLLTTTHAGATAAGWVAGGHVGLGSSVFGSVWDDVVRRLRVVTVEETPRVLVLEGTDAYPLLHTYGAFGIITEVAFRTEPQHRWIECAASFPSYRDAVEAAAQITAE